MSMTIVIAPGPPATGKSTFFRRFIEIISPDSLLYENGKYVWTPERADAAWAECYRHIIAAAELGSGSIGFDACLVDAKSRKKFRDRILSGLSPEARDNVRFVAYNLPRVDLETLFARNATRTPDRKIPESSITGMYNRWTPAESSEGFEIMEP